MVSFLHGHIVVYPMGKLVRKNTQYLLLIAQKENFSLQLYAWNQITQEVIQLLSSQFTPGGVVFNKGQDSFAFIDNGRIRIKQLVKRSPKSLDIFDPISNIVQVGWLDNAHLYLCAQLLGRFGIFIVNQKNDLIKLLWHKKYDYLWPQKIGSYLAYIKRINEVEYECKETQVNVYMIEKCCIPEKFKVSHDKECIFSLVKNGKIDSCAEGFNYEILNNFGVLPIAYLQMIGLDSGYVISHSSRVNSEDKFIEFGCWFFDRAHKKKLFSFSIPTGMLWGEGRLYESLKPLLPQYHKGFWYFLDAVNSILQLHTFNDSTRKIIQLTHSPTHIIGTYIFDDRIFYGGIFSDIYGGATLDIPWVRCYDNGIS